MGYLARTHSLRGLGTTMKAGTESPDPEAVDNYIEIVFWTQQGIYKYELTVVVVACARLDQKHNLSMEWE